MIVWFSGTGNSRYVARRLARLVGDSDMSLSAALEHSVALAPGEALGLVFPVYGWGLPPRVAHDLCGLLSHIAPSVAYVYVVLTCGDDIGRTDREVCRCFARYGFAVDAVWSVVMPNTYVALPGFDVDAPDVVAQKLAALPARLSAISQTVLTRRHGVRDVRPGALPWLKSHIVRPLFNSLFVNDRPFCCSDACISCGRCVQVCPVGNVTLTAAGRPQWHGSCTACMACYHHCPRHAINRGPGATRHKGQYVPPEQ